MCSLLEQAGKERERIKEREKGEPYTCIPDSRGEESSEITKLPTTKWEVLYLYTVL